MSDYKLKILDWPSSERPRERLVKLGPEKLSDAEILAILLRVGDRETTAIDLSRKIMNHFDGFRGLDSCSIAELCQIKGVGIAKAAQVKAALELGKRLFIAESTPGNKVSSSEDVYSIVSPHMRALSREVFKVLLLTTRNTIIAEKVLFEGTLDESIVSPREIVKEALNHSAASVVFVHNHPSGNPEPSEEDKRVTRHLKKACESVSIRVMDHIIIGEQSYYSFADCGLL